MGNPVTKWQILAKDPERTEAFYGQLFGWTVNRDNALGYRMVDTGSKRGIPGGIWPSPPEGHAFVQLFVEVEDLAAHLDRARALGAQIVIPLSKLPWRRDGVILDPDGIPVALHPAHGVNRSATPLEPASRFSRRLEARDGTLDLVALLGFGILCEELSVEVDRLLNARLG